MRDRLGESRRRLAAGARAIPTLPGRGFTLIELLIVMAVLALLLAIIVPSYNVMAEQGNRGNCAANMKAIGQALSLFREDYQCFPPDQTESLIWPDDLNALDGDTANLLEAAYGATGGSVEVHGLGLLTLFYLGVYAETPPPLSSEPRIGAGLRQQLEGMGKGLNGLPWFRRGRYITELRTFHCPSNVTPLDEDQLLVRGDLPALGGWNNYDRFYRRNFWHPGTTLLEPEQGGRHLLQAYPPADTVVTWCPYHRKSNPPPGPGVYQEVSPGDYDLVLFVDGSVRRVASRSDNRMFEEPPGDTQWPAGPLM